MPPTPPYVLADALQTWRDWPDTFDLPDAEERASVPEGWFVKLVFKLLEPPPGMDNPPDAERMWVRVVARDEEGPWVGELANEPEWITALALGARVEFTPDHIIDIAPPPSAVPREAIVRLVREDDDDVHDEEFAFVSRLVLEGRLARIAERTPPIDPNDSGWLLLSGEEDPADEDEASDLIAPVCLHCVLQRVPALDAVLDAEYHTRWTREDEGAFSFAGEIEPEEDEEDV